MGNFCAAGAKLEVCVFNLEVGGANNPYDVHVATTENSGKPYQLKKDFMLKKKAGLIVLLVSMVASDLFAGTLVSYTAGDVLIGFRKSGGANDLVVDAGPISTFIGYPANSTNTITQFTGSQLALVGTNGVSWSAFTSSGDSQTLYVTKARTSTNAKTSPWLNAPNNPTVAGDMGECPLGALDNLAYNGLNTSTAVIEPDVSAGNPNYLTGLSYHDTLDPNGTGDFNFGGDFQGNPENTTSNNFTISGTVVRSDFYSIPTGNGFTTNGVTFLGYFEFSTNGVMTYVAYPSAPVVASRIVSIVRTGTTNTITFTTGPTGTYTLLGTNLITAPKATWPAISSVSGNNGNRSLTDVITGGSKFYIISAQ